MSISLYKTRSNVGWTEKKANIARFIIQIYSNPSFMYPERSETQYTSQKLTLVLSKKKEDRKNVPFVVGYPAKGPKTNYSALDRDQNRRCQRSWPTRHFYLGGALQTVVVWRAIEVLLEKSLSRTLRSGSVPSTRKEQKTQSLELAKSRTSREHEKNGLRAPRTNYLDDLSQFISP